MHSVGTGAAGNPGTRDERVRPGGRPAVGCRAYSVSVTPRPANQTRIARLEFEHEYDLPRTIVWDALTDPVLIGGWLGEARVLAVVGGRFDLEWLGSRDFAPTTGRIDQLAAPERLVVTTEAHGILDFGLEPLDGGSRGTSTRLRLAVTLTVDPAFLGRVRANWTVSLDQLSELLRGHPVDWSAGEVNTSSGDRAEL